MSYRSAAKRPVRDWLVPETRRSWTATLVSVALGVVAHLVFPSVLDVGPDDSLESSLAAALTVWVAIAVIHTALTWIAFSGRAGEDLSVQAARVRPDRRERTWWSNLPGMRAVVGSGDGPSWTVAVAVCALVGVGMLVVSRDAREEPVLMGLGVGLVIAFWISVVVVNAVQYARMDLEEGAADLHFPGDEQRSFADYCYFSLGVQATFGATDVSVLTTRMRRIVTIHSFVAFVYNTVILAIVVSLISGA